MRCTRSPTNYIAYAALVFTFLACNAEPNPLRTENYFNSIKWHATHARWFSTQILKRFLPLPKISCILFDLNDSFVVSEKKINAPCTWLDQTLTKKKLNTTKWTQLNRFGYNFFFLSNFHMYILIAPRFQLTFRAATDRPKTADWLTGWRCFFAVDVARLRKCMCVCHCDERVWNASVRGKQFDSTEMYN